MTEETSAERKQAFVGSILKCPSCGAHIGTDTAKCPACGFVIEKKTVSGVMETFVAKFTALEDDEAKKELIESYPVPNNKEDIRGFLTYAASQRDKDFASDESRAFWVEAWNNKCKQIINQAVDVFGADEDFMRYLKDYRADVAQSSEANKKLRGRLRTAKLVKRAAVALVVLAVIGAAAGFVAADKMKKAAAEKARQELIAGCIVPKENLTISGARSGEYIEILSDAVITTTNISQRKETDSDDLVWCLDSTVTFDYQTHESVYDLHLDTQKKAFPDYYSSPEFLALGHAWFFSRPENVDSSYQSKLVTAHSFDNIRSTTEALLGAKADQPRRTLIIRLTQVANSKEECEELAIRLHESGRFDFIINIIFNEYYLRWLNE